MNRRPPISTRTDPLFPSASLCRSVLEALKEGRPLTEAERDINDRGLVTLICQHHDTIDALVAEAYGWPANLSGEEVLTRLVALNKERAAEDRKSTRLNSSH